MVRVMRANVMIWPEPTDLHVDCPSTGPVCRIGFVSINADLDTQQLLAEKWLRDVKRAKAEQDHCARAKFRMMRPTSWRWSDPDEVRDSILAGDMPAPLGWQGGVS